MRAKQMLELKKEKKREKKLATKQRERRALGISNESFGLEEDEELFSLNPNLTLGDLNGVVDVDLATEDVHIPRDKYEDEEMARAEGKGKEVVFIHPDEEDLEEELEAEYARFLNRRKLRENKTVEEQDREDEFNEKHGEGREYTEKKARHERQPEQILKRIKNEDEQLMSSLNRNDDRNDDSDVSDNHDSDSEDDGFFDRQDDEEDDEFDYGDDSDDDEVQNPAKKAKRNDSKPIVVKESGESEMYAEKWFSHPIFKETVMTGSTYSEDSPPSSSSSKPLTDITKRRKSRGDDSADSDEGDERPFTGEEMIAMMPRTDKEVRSAKRSKENARKERREAKKKKQSNESRDDEDALFDKKEMQVVANNHEDYSSWKIKTSGEDGDDVELDRETLLKREMLRKGMGKSITNSVESSEAVEIVPQEGDDDEDVDSVDENGYPRRHDDRLYDSDEEIYDKHDRAMTLALGTMMLRNSKRKNIVDSSYNRYSWNDPKDLPAWFLDDEMKHNKPQTPVPKALLDQIKGNFNLTAKKEIKKVTEARARKRKRAMSQLKTAKKQAAAVADNSELSDKQKVRAIAKAMKNSGKSNTAPGKVLVVARKTNGASVGTSKGGKGKFKFVDKRSKKDRRAMKVNEARKKKGRKKSRK